MSEPAASGETAPAASSGTPVARGPASGPRERLRAAGARGLRDADLLALLLGSGVPGRSALRIAARLPRRPPAELATWPLARWMLTPGIGLARAAALVAAFELG